MSKNLEKLNYQTVNSVKEQCKTVLMYLSTQSYVTAFSVFVYIKHWMADKQLTGHFVSSTLQLSMCLVPPRQGALGGFSYSCHVYTLAKQGLRTLQGGTEEGGARKQKAR